MVVLMVISSVKAVRGSILVHVEPSPREREKEKRYDR